MADLRIALVGLGRFGRLHAETLRGLPGCRLAALCDADPDVLERCGDEWEVADRYLEVGDLLAGTAVDAVDIVTGETDHGRQAPARARGRPRRVRREAAGHAARRGGGGRRRWPSRPGCRSASATSRASTPATRFLRRECEAGRFGRVALVSAQRTFSRAWFAGFGSRVHPVFESMVHDLDLALWYLPARVRRVYAQSAVSGAADSDVPDVLVATLTAADGSLAVLQSTWLAPDAAPINLPGPPASPFELWGTIDGRLDLVGTAQTGRVNVLGDGLSVWNDAHHRAPDTSLWPEVHGRVTGALREELAHWLDCVRSGTRSEIAPLEDAVTAVRLAEAIVRSAGSGAAVDVA